MTADGPTQVVKPPEERNLASRLTLGAVDGFYSAFTTPASWLRDMLNSTRQDYPWYHRQYRRVPTVDECELSDIVCITEADHQYRRDMLVESHILAILKKRHEDCLFYEYPGNEDPRDPRSPCYELKKTFDECAKNYYIKYGDLSFAHDVREAFMKQKHRMIWERRHGEVGSGINPDWKPPKV